MVKRKNRQADGFTLIELMLASALLMSVMFAGYLGYSLYSQKWQKRVELYWHSTQQGIGLEALNRLFVSASSYIVKNDEGKYSAYFEATQQEIRLVTNSPILSTGAALVSLEIQNKGNVKQLVYKEKNLANSPFYRLTELQVFEQWQKQVVILKDLEEISWSFYGWTSFNDASKQVEINEIGAINELRTKYEVHELSKIRVLPAHINLTIKHQTNESKLKVAMPNHTIFSVLANARSSSL